MASKAILLAIGAIGQYPDQVLAAILAALFMVLCLYLMGWAALLLWTFGS